MNKADSEGLKHHASGAVRWPPPCLLCAARRRHPLNFVQVPLAEARLPAGNAAVFCELYFRGNASEVRPRHDDPRREVAQMNTMVCVRRAR